MNTIHKRVAALALALIALLLIVAGTTYADDEMVPRFTFGGGAEQVSSNNVVLRGALGQPIAGVSQSEGPRICTGFECGTDSTSANTPTATATTDPSATETPTPTATATTDPSEPSETETPTSSPTATATSSATPTATPTGTPDEPQSGSSSDIVIHEVYYTGNEESDWIELKNIGDGTVDISEWYFCALFSYKKLGENPTLLQGDLSLAPGEIVVLKSWTDLDANKTGSDLAIYKNDPVKPEGRPDFSNPDFMVDFVQWGTAEDVGRSDVAVAKGIWAQTSTNPARYDYAPAAESGMSLSLKSSNKGSASIDFANQAPTQGTNNSSSSGEDKSNKIFLPLVRR